MRGLLATTVLVGAAQAASADAPRIAVDIAPIHSIVASVTAGVTQPDLIIPPGASPHDHSLRPSEARVLNEADIVIWMGEGLTPWLGDPIETLAGDALHVELLEHPATTLLPLRTGATFADDGHGHDDHGHEGHADDKDHAHDGHAKMEDHHDHGHDDHAADAAHGDHDGHAHGTADGKDAHAWLDPQNAIAWADAVATLLSEIDPENASTYKANAASFSSDMKMLSGDVEAMLAPVRGRPFVVFHDAYHYFEHRFEIEAIGALKSGDASDASPARLAALRDEVAEAGAVCALAEPQYNPGLIDVVGAAKLGEIDPVGAAIEPGPALYATLIRTMAATLADCLG